MALNDTCAAWAPRVLSVLRIMAALLLLQHGLSKFFGFPMAMNTPAMFSLYWWAGAIEIVGGVLLLLGLFTRPVAFLLSGEMAVAYFQVHFQMAIWPWANNGEIVILYCFTWLYFSAAGAGPWSLDAKLRAKS